jgi:hypothetical protein
MPENSAAFGEVEYFGFHAWTFVPLLILYGNGPTP